MPMEMLDGIKDTNQFLPDVLGFDRLMEKNRKAFGVGWYSTLSKKSWIGSKDPVCWFFVVDALARGTPGYAIKARDLSDWLNRERKWAFFSPQTVNQVMLGVYNMIWRCLGEKHGQTLMPFERYVFDRRKGYYCVDPPKSVEVYGPDTGRILMMGLRKQLMIVARANMVHESRKRWFRYPKIEDYVYLDEETLTWKLTKAPLKPGKPPSHFVVGDNSETWKNGEELSGPQYHSVATSSLRGSQPISGPSQSS